MWRFFLVSWRQEYNDLLIFFSLFCWRCCFCFYVGKKFFNSVALRLLAWAWQTLKIELSVTKIRLVQTKKDIFIQTLPDSKRSIPKHLDSKIISGTGHLDSWLIFYRYTLGSLYTLQMEVVWSTFVCWLVLKLA